MCGLFGYSKQAFYKQISSQKKKSIKTSKIKSMVLEQRAIMPRLGTRKLHYILKGKLKEEGLSIGRDRLFDLLRSEDLLISRRKSYTKTTNSRHWMKKYPNIVKDIDITRPEQLWVADITYILTKGKPLYLHLITDAYSKQIMGAELSHSLSTDSTIKALRSALNKRRYPEQELIHHSDRGLQYCSAAYIKILNKHDIKISMTENSDPYENAIAERINGILKDEFGLGGIQDNAPGIRPWVKQSVDIYNELRPHLSCQMLTPIQMHEQNTIKLKKWKKKTSTAFKSC